ncbi:hypothetical protein MMC16_004410 [Acarospora aff. strigata]|nr:hypothetical protein [Acarospora aff. strigata]
MSSASQTTTPQTLSSSSTAASVSSQAVPRSAASSPSATVIGLSVGISLAVIAAVAAFGALFFRWRRSRKPEPQQEQYSKVLAGSGLAPGAPNELPGGMGVSELMADKTSDGAQELETRRGRLNNI